VKAPNYELEQQRRAGQINEPRIPRPRTDKYENVAPKSRSNSSGQDGKSTPAGEPGTTRLNRYIANSGVCSRREADELIARGDITVNGKVVTEMGFRVKEGDMVKYGTKALTPERFVYVLLNKPKDYITTTEDPEERKTVMELVADAGNFRMYPVGRLDRKTTGLLLLTNDGELADKLTHPSNEARKIYQVELDKPITEEHFDALKKGIELEDGPIKPDALSIVTPDAYVVGIEIHSGRNRIVRRMFESLGYEVTKLDRTAYAGLTKKELPRGKWRFLDPKEVVKLKYLS
jgi:23S rRNA pseudouridine2605 synthase